jgi:glycosyltransferase involved in cell wall biosynthesis
VLPRQPRDRALAFLGLADVLVSPRAHGNNLPLKIGDYMAASKPIVATKIPAHTSVLDSSRAILTDADGEGLASGILTVLSDEKEAERLATAAKAYGDRYLSWGAFRDSIDDHVHRLRA